MGEKIIGYVLINTEVGKESEVAIAIKQKYGDIVSEAVLTYGIYDIVVRFVVDSFMKSNEIVSFIREIPGVKRTETLLGFPVEV